MKEKNIEVLGDGRHIKLLSKDGWEFVERVNVKGIVVILAITDDEKIVLVEQYRPPIDKNVIEMPAGLVGDIGGFEDEQMETAARRELLEETGYEAETMKLFTEGPISAGLSREVISFYFAKGLKKVHQGGGDETEDIIVHEVPLRSAEEWIKSKTESGILIDPKIYIGLYFSNRLL